MTTPDTPVLGGGDRASVAESELAVHAASPDAAAILEQAALICEQVGRSFLSPKYATGQPLSSFAERFACRHCAEAIRDLAKALPSSPGVGASLDGTV